MSDPILPPAAIGVLGSGQLGRMLALAARQMGYRVHVYSPDADSPTGQVADREFCAPYDDADALRRFAQGIAVATYEFENVPAATARAVAEWVPLRPSAAVLAIASHRLREKTTLAAAGLPVTPFAPVAAESDLHAAAAAVGLPAVLKTAVSGYDGKGQVRIDAPAELVPAWQALGRVEAILEAFLPLRCELSVVAARGLDGQIACYEPFENAHSHHILDVTCCPARVEARIRREALEIAAEVVRALEVVGVLCVELFLTDDGRLLINEIAPRPHNSGHLTIEACATSQFEQQLRAVCGLPLGATTLRAPAAMANLLGDLWAEGAPNWPAVLARPDVHLHLYGKAQARPGRKMGHITALGATADDARETAVQARAATRPSRGEKR